MEAARGNRDELRHAAVEVVSEAQALRTEVVFAYAAVGAAAADARRGFRNHAVPLAESARPRAHAGNDAGKFVTQNDGHAHWPTVRVVVLVNLAAADADRARREEYFVIGEGARRLDPPKLHPHWLQSVLDDGLHQTIERLAH